MIAFVVTYVVFWLAVALYVVRLGSRQRKLQDRLLALQSQLAPQSQLDSTKR